MAFDFDLFVIGAGSGGVRAARFAAGFGARVAVAEEFARRGAQVWVATSPGLPATAQAGRQLPLMAVAHPALAPLVGVQSFYRAVNALALRRGHDPDQPPHLNKVTETI